MPSAQFLVTTLFNNALISICQEMCSKIHLFNTVVTTEKKWLHNMYPQLMITTHDYKLTTYKLTTYKLTTYKLTTYKLSTANSRKTTMIVLFSSWSAQRVSFCLVNRFNCFIYINLLYRTNNHKHHNRQHKCATTVSSKQTRQLTHDIHTLCGTAQRATSSSRSLTA